MHMLVDLVWPSCVWMVVAGEALVCVCRCGAWMFPETLIHFRFGKFLHYPYVLPLGEVMPNFSAACIPLGEVRPMHVCACVAVLIFCSVYTIGRQPWSSR